jgi:hypothetical protein
MSRPINRKDGLLTITAFAMLLCMPASPLAGCAEPALPIEDAREELTKEIGKDTLVWGKLDSLKTFAYVAGTDYSYRSSGPGKPVQQGRKIMIMGAPTVQVATYYVTALRHGLSYTVSSTQTSNYCQRVDPRVGDSVPVLFESRPLKIILNYDGYFGYRIIPASDTPGGYRLTMPE